ncbi:hypothetical protein SAMN05877753_103227 [Bacillus oleivorans]|uniref:Uncharacterized protein n=1 Tax=Bacillus oleivorans TaxID=1448271 RepID=A0A285CS41_9BACI|nr:hypothetical protein [Bacillus oleivorans]SNX69783.1 hypothetical protein SAMN05877753_103227 [Bacillus oleivorans]
MDYVIEPYESVGPIKLSMTKEEIRCLMPEKPANDHYFRGPYTDFFVKSGLFAYYIGENGVCEAIEFSQQTTAIFQEKHINSVPFI